MMTVFLACLSYACVMFGTYYGYAVFTSIHATIKTNRALKHIADADEIEQKIASVNYERTIQ